MNMKSTKRKDAEKYNEIFNQMSKVFEALLVNDIISKEYKFGGPVDPEGTEADEIGKDFVTRWMSHPETRKRYRANMNELEGTKNNNLGTDNAIFQKGLVNLKNTKSTFNKAIPNITGSYQNKKIDYYGTPTVGTTTHEQTHATEDISNNLSQFGMQKYGLLKSLREKYPGENTEGAIQKEFNTGKYGTEGVIEQASYMGSNGELYPRFMEMRQFLNVIPGQVITDEMIKKLAKNPKTNKTVRFYKPEKLKEILNTIASTDSENAKNIAAYGGKITTNNMKTKKKKYGLGTSIKNYMDDPSTKLAQNQIDIANAQLQAATNPWLIGLSSLGNSAMQYGINMKNPNGSSGFGDSTGGKAANALLPILGNMQFAFGGGIPGGVPVEVEGQEVGEMPNGEMIEFKGPSHEQGGIDTQLPAGTEMYSKRIKVDGIDMATRAKKRKKKEMTLEQLMEKNSSDVLIKNSLSRTKETNVVEESADQKIQEYVTQLEGKKGEHKFGDSVKNPFSFDPNAMQDQMSNFLASIAMSKNNGMPTLGNFGPNLNIPQVFTGAENTLKGNSLDLGSSLNLGKPLNFDMNKSQKKVGNFVEGIGGPEKETSNNGMLTSGDMISMLGTAYSAFAPMQNTLKSRAGDTPNINPFENYGKNGLNSISEAMGMVQGQEDKAIKDIGTSTAAQIKRGRNSARGVNQMRMSDLAASMQESGAVSEARNNAAKMMQELFGTQAGLQNQQDQVVMQGEATRDDNDRRDRDNFFSQLGIDKASAGQGVQELGKDFNQLKQNEVVMKLMSQVSKYGYFNKAGEFIPHKK